MDFNYDGKRFGRLIFEWTIESFFLYITFETDSKEKSLSKEVPLGRIQRI